MTRVLGIARALRIPTDPGSVSHPLPTVARVANPSGLRVCTTCWELRGPIGETVTDEDGNRVPLVQLCGCDRAELRSRGETEPEWPGYDMSHAFGVCACCAAELVSSSSRWSSYYCAGCRAVVIRLNERAGTCVVPYGPHFLLDQRFEQGRRPRKSQIDEFLRGIRHLADRTELLGRWERSRMEAVVAAADLPDDDPEGIPVRAYLSAAGRQWPSKQAALDAMLEYLAEVGEPRDEEPDR